MLSHLVLATEQGVIGNSAQNKFLNVNFFIFLNFLRGPSLWKLVTGTENGSQNMVTGTKNGSENWLPEQNLVIKYGYRNKTWSSNMVTGTESGHQIWLPEQKVVIKYGYRNKFIICVIFIEIEAWVSNIPAILTFCDSAPRYTCSGNHFSCTEYPQYS